MRDKKGIFNSRYYGLIMNVSISFVLLMIIFSSASIMKDVDRSSLTGYAVEDIEESGEEESFEKVDEEADVDEVEGDEELYSEKSYLIYFVLLGFLGFCIFILTAMFLVPRMKDWT